MKTQKPRAAISFASLVALATGAVNLVRDVVTSHAISTADYMFIIAAVAGVLYLVAPLFGIQIEGHPGTTETVASSPAPTPVPTAITVGTGESVTDPSVLRRGVLS